MDPDQQFCSSETCLDCGKVRKGNITIRSQKKKRYYCKTCEKTFTATHSTFLYR